MTDERFTALVCIWIVAAVALLFGMPYAFGQEHHHPPQDQEIHKKFYQTWMLPDAPNSSCCNDKDCYPTEARFRDGHWYGKRREDEKWILIPDKKIEQRRDNPDGRSHMCAPPPQMYTADQVYCFILGWGL